MADLFLILYYQKEGLAFALQTPPYQSALRCDLVLRRIPEPFLSAFPCQEGVLFLREEHILFLNIYIYFYFLTHGNQTNYIQFSVFYRKASEYADNPQEDSRNYLTTDSLLRWLAVVGKDDNALGRSRVAAERELCPQSSQVKPAFLSETQALTGREPSGIVPPSSHMLWGQAVKISLEHLEFFHFYSKKSRGKTPHLP